MFIDAIFVHVYKLTDKRKDALGLKRLVKIFSQYDKQQVIQSSFEAIINLQENIEKWRNLYIGHRNYRQFLERDTNPLPEIPRKEITEIIHEIHEFMNQGEILMGKKPKRYDQVSHLVNTKYFFNVLTVGENNKKRDLGKW
jgi:hypothetical protein